MISSQFLSLLVLLLLLQCSTGDEKSGQALKDYPTSGHLIRCKCSATYCHDSDEECTTESGLCFVRMKEQSEPRISYQIFEKGCVSVGIEQIMYCNTSDVQYRCCMTDLCNDAMFMTDPPTPVTGPITPNTQKVVAPRPGSWPAPSSSLNYPIYIVGAIVFFIVMILGGILALRNCNTRTTQMSWRTCDIKTTRRSSTASKMPWQCVPPLADSPDVTGSCSSGSGIPRLLDKTLIREITFSEQIGKGRYGAVWRARWRADSQVAVKVFSNREVSSWWHEAEMYQNYWLRHDNILSFIGADQKDCVTNMEYYLVIEYLPRGSLYDFLHDALLSTQEGIRLVLSLASGLDYLHSEIKSSIAKPSIAHRDLKSKNVLVKNTGKGFQCCIADFGLAARSDFFDNLPDKSTFNYQVGTRRYMAPEILDSSIKLASFESLRKADMYMFGLIAWEISHRMGGNARPYQYPYQNEVTGDPSITEMKTVVVDQGRRPQLPVWWEGDGSLAELSHITRECWDREPSVRLTSLRVRKNLARLSDRRVLHRDSGCYLTDNSDHGSSGQTTYPDAGIRMT